LTRSRKIILTSLVRTVIVRLPESCANKSVEALTSVDFGMIGSQIRLDRRSPVLASGCGTGVNGGSILLSFVEQRLFAEACRWLIPALGLWFRYLGNFGFRWQSDWASRNVDLLSYMGVLVGDLFTDRFFVDSLAALADCCSVQSVVCNRVNMSNELTVRTSKKHHESQRC
jgi:hypothetical protein